MKKENIKELTDKELQDRLEQVQKEYVQEKIQHTISRSIIRPRLRLTETDPLQHQDRDPRT